MYRRFQPYLQHLRSQRTLLAFAVLCGLIYGVATGFGLPYMVKTVFPVIFAPNAVPLGARDLVLLAAWLPAIFLVRGVSLYLNTYLIQVVGTRVLETIRVDLFRKLQVLPLSYFQRNATGDLLSRVLADANQLQIALTTTANEVIKSPAALVSAILYVAYQAYQSQGLAMVLATLGVVPLTVLPIRYVGRKLLRRSGQIQTELGSVSSLVSENLSAAKEVRAFNLEDLEVQRFSRVSRLLIRAQLKFFKYEKVLTPLIEIISAFSLSLTFIYAYRVHLALENFIMLITALYVCYDPIKKLGGLNNELNRGIGALNRIEEVLLAPVSIVDPPAPHPIGRLTGRIAFQDVSFSYRGSEPALRNVSAAIPAGTICALVGPSGAGKSTFANLVPRFFDADAGAVTIDGIDVRAMRVAELRRNIALVSQEPVLFNDTVCNNLQLGRPGATRVEVEQAARDAFAHDFITALPKGYDTVVGERGGSLSGGQRQRIALARAFLRNAPILILDEATSALDSESEATIQEALKKLVVGKTVLIIAHRFSTIRDANLILVFNEGELVAQGPHASVYASSPLYRAAYDRQQID